MKAIKIKDAISFLTELIYCECVCVLGGGNDSRDYSL